MDRLGWANSPCSTLKTAEIDAEMTAESQNLPPLAPGDLAVRFRLSWRGRPARPVTIGLQAVEVVAVDGEAIVWTDNRPIWPGERTRFVHRSDRRELMSLAAFEAITPKFHAELLSELAEHERNETRSEPAKPALPGAAASSRIFRPRRRRPAAWYQSGTYA